MAAVADVVEAERSDLTAGKSSAWPWVPPSREHTRTHKFSRLTKHLDSFSFPHVTQSITITLLTNPHYKNTITNVISANNAFIKNASMTKQVIKKTRVFSNQPIYK